MHLQLSSIEEVIEGIKTCFENTSEQVFTFHFSGALASENAQPDYNWVAYDLGVRAKVFQGHRMQDAQAFACELYAVLQLPFQENTHLDAMYDDMYEFDHWIDGGDYVFVLDQYDKIMRQEPNQREKYLGVITRYIKLVNTKEHYPDRRAILVLAQ